MSRISSLLLLLGVLVLALVAPGLTGTAPQAVGQTLSYTWTGTTNNVWDLSSTAQNWVTSGAVSSYTDSSNVTFDDTAAGNTNPILITAGGVQPASVIFNNNALVYSFSGGAISGAATTVAVNNGGLVIFDNANTYGGGTTITSGTLQLGNGAVNGSVAGGISVGGVLAFDNAAAQTFGGAISGGGAINLMAPSLVTLTNANAFTGVTTVSAGTLQLGNGVVNGSLAGNIVNNASLVLDSVGTQNYAGSITGAGGLLKIGTGTFTLSGINSYSGTTTLTTGGIGLVAGAALSTSAVTINNGAGTFSMSGGTLTASGASTFTNNSGGFVMTGGQANFNGGINYGTDDANNGNYFEVSGGTLTTPWINTGRSSMNYSTLALAEAERKYECYYCQRHWRLNITGSVNLGAVTPNNSNSSSGHADHQRQSDGRRSALYQPEQYYSLFGPRR